MIVTPKVHCVTAHLSPVKMSPDCPSVIKFVLHEGRSLPDPSVCHSPVCVHRLLQLVIEDKLWVPEEDIG